MMIRKQNKYELLIAKDFLTHQLGVNSAFIVQYNHLT